MELPLTKTDWEYILSLWKYFVLVAPIQFSLPNFYPTGKTWMKSIFNVPGKAGWIFMELCSPAALLYSIYTNPSRPSPLPSSHKWLITLYCMHYFHRALLSPLRNPSMAPTHIIITLAGIAFNLINGSMIGGWLGGFGSTTKVPTWQIVAGSGIFLAGLWGNIYHEEILRDIRNKPEKTSEDEVVVNDNGRVYKVPQGGLFSYIWYPHYFVEWCEWTGYMIAGGGPLNFLPATLFVVNEIATMLPRALQGKRWYEKKFGDKTPQRKAVIPGII